MIHFKNLKLVHLCYFFFREPQRRKTPQRSSWYYSSLIVLDFQPNGLGEPFRPQSL